jgi:hypothetical protein
MSGFAVIILNSAPSAHNFRTGIAQEIQLLIYFQVTVREWERYSYVPKMKLNL